MGAHRAEPADITRGPALRHAVAVPSADAMRDLGAELASTLRAGDLVVLTGGLGAGKTTLARGLGAGLGVRGDVTSPTFVIARVHPSLTDGPALVHVDAYRLSSLEEVDDLDLDASLEESVTVVEWGEGLVEELAAAHLSVTLERDPTGAGPDDAPPGEDEPRLVRFAGYGERWAGIDLPGAELTDPGLTDPELTDPELTDPELTEPSRGADAATADG
jgi:tRNA threonylcarbamoyladenosine biosynthesis protein TsaE